MFQALVSAASRFFHDLSRSWYREHLPPRELLETPTPPARTYGPLQRVVLTDEVSRTLFEGYAAHRAGACGEEETGWVLLGVREADEATIMATLPAGANRDAGVAHILFNSDGQALASRIVRQWHRRLAMLGVVHTHPGSLRHPSDGDFRGDSQWVGQLKGREGIFGIGTADGEPAPNIAVARQPLPHVQCMGELRFSWYSLREGDRCHRPLKIDLTLGPDLARPLHPIWLTIERYANPLDRLFRQQAGLSFRVVELPEGPALGVDIGLAEPGEKLCLVLRGKEPRYYLARGDELLAVDPDEERVDRGVYLLLAELAASC
jgi:hypothetical protein